MDEVCHVLHKGDKAYHLRLGRVGTVLHVSPRRGGIVSPRRGGMVLLQFADGTDGSYPVDALRAHDPEIGDVTVGWTVPCRVETSE